MKKNFKKYVGIVLVIVLALALSGCGEDKNENHNNEGNNPNPVKESILNNVSGENYKEAASEFFGMSVDNPSGWTLEKVSGNDEEGILNIDYIVNNGEDGKTVIESYFNKSLNIGTVYSYVLDDSASKMIKGSQYSDFTTFAEKNIAIMKDFYSAMWVYEYDNKTIIFGISMETDEGSISFSLLK